MSLSFVSLDRISLKNGNLGAHGVGHAKHDEANWKFIVAPNVMLVSHLGPLEHPSPHGVASTGREIHYNLQHGAHMPRFEYRGAL